MFLTCQQVSSMLLSVIKYIIFVEMFNFTVVMNVEDLIYKKLNRTANTKTIDIRELQNPINKNLFYIKKNEKHNYIKHRLQSLKQSFLDILEIEDFMPINHMSSTSFYIYGVITKITDQKLSKDNAYISSNIDESNNILLKLNFSNIKKISIFPGQIVALYGKNTYNEFLVERIHSIPIMDINDITMDELVKYESAYANNNLQIAIANGPFVNDPEVLESILENQFDVLILIGPFLSVYNENVDCLNYFDSIKASLESWLKKSMTSKIVIVPSIDEYRSLIIYPQQKYTDFKNDRIIFVSNPSLFYINEFLFGVCNFDNLMQLAVSEFAECNESDRDDECTKLLFDGDKICRLSHYLIYQRSFLPVFPNKQCVDYTCSDSFDIDTMPDVYITTSKLKEFDRNIERTMVINLGCQTKIENKHMVVLSVGKAEDVKDGELILKRTTVTRQKIK